MSIVVAVKNGSTVTIGSDRAITYKTNIHFGGPKYVDYGCFVLGIVGGTRFSGCVQDFFNEFEGFRLRDSDVGIVYNEVAMPLRTVLMAEEQVAKEGDIEYAQGELILICNEIYLIDGSFGVTTCEDDFVCLGSGEQIAKGYCEGVRGIKSGEALVEGAIKAACKYDSCCDGFVMDTFELVD